MNQKRVVYFLALGMCVLFLSGILDAVDLKSLGGIAWGKYYEEGMANYFKKGFCFGMGVEMGNRPLTVEIDVLYFLKTNDYGSRGWEFEMREISIPALTKFWLRSDLPFYLAAGLEGGYILSHKQFPGPSGEGYYDYTDSGRRLDFGLVFAAGLEVLLDRIALSVEGRYHRGMVKTTKFFSDDGYAFMTRELVVLGGLKLVLW